MTLYGNPREEVNPSPPEAGKAVIHSFSQRAGPCPAKVQRPIFLSMLFLCSESIFPHEKEEREKRENLKLAPAFIYTPSNILTAFRVLKESVIPLRIQTLESG
jgi:hypothetical protein